MCVPTFACVCASLLGLRVGARPHPTRAPSRPIPTVEVTIWRAVHPRPALGAQCGRGGLRTTTPIVPGGAVDEVGRPQEQTRRARVRIDGNEVGTGGARGHIGLWACTHTRVCVNTSGGIHSLQEGTSGERDQHIQANTLTRTASHTGTQRASHKHTHTHSISNKHTHSVNHTQPHKHRHSGTQTQPRVHPAVPVRT